jgi:tetratricopeptide (TPR) repeat protein
MKLKNFSFILLFSVLSVSLFAQDEKPIWLEYQNGIESFKNHLYGEAMAIFKRCALRNPRYPEAEYWIGKIFEMEGELELAEAQYRKALQENFRTALTIPDFEYTIRSSLAGVLKTQGRSDEYIAEIENILNSDSFYTGEYGQKNIDSIAKLWRSKGINRVFELYRIQNRRFAVYYAEAGIYYYSRGEYEKAFRLLAVPVLSALSEMGEIQKKIHPDFIFTSQKNFDKREYPEGLEEDLKEFHLKDVSELISISISDAKIAEYLVNADFFKNFYYIGVLLAELGETQYAFESLMLCSRFNVAGLWQKMALKKMQSLVDYN